MEELAQDKRLQMKEFFNLWIERTSYSKTILFLSFQTVQNKQRGAALQALLRFLSLKGASQPKRVSLTEKGITQLTPNKENKRSHKTFALEQWIRMWFIVSSSSQHKGHLLQFLSFHAIQKICKGVAFQTFLHLLPTKGPCHPRRVSLMVATCVQWIPNSVNNNYQRTHHWPKTTLFSKVDLLSKHFPN